MALTEQSNTTLAELARTLLELDDFCICGHVSPDGDCVGSQLALAHALRACGKSASVVLARNDAIDRALCSIPGADELVAAADYRGECSAFIAVDVPTRERLGDASTLLDAASWSATIDHHAADRRMTDLAVVDPDAASTTLLVWQLAKHLGVADDPLVATCAFTGLMTDTGRFQYQNADATAFAAASEMVSAGAKPHSIAKTFFQNRSVASIKLEGLAVERMRFIAGGTGVASYISAADMASLGASKADAEPIIDVLRSISDVRVACVVREQGEEIRVSLRAKDDTDVSEIARAFGGGGHKAASGCTMRDRSVQDAFEIICARIEDALAEGEGRSW